MFLISSGQVEVEVHENGTQTGYQALCLELLGVYAPPTSFEVVKINVSTCFGVCLKMSLLLVCVCVVKKKCFVSFSSFQAL